MLRSRRMRRSTTLNTQRRVDETNAGAVGEWQWRYNSEKLIKGFSMNAIRIRKKLDSEILNLPEFRFFLAQLVPFLRASCRRGEAGEQYLPEGGV